LRSATSARGRRARPASASNAMFVASVRATTRAAMYAPSELPATTIRRTLSSRAIRCESVDSYARRADTGSRAGSNVGFSRKSLSTSDETSGRTQSQLRRSRSRGGRKRTRGRKDETLSLAPCASSREIEPLLPEMGHKRALPRQSLPQP
jgi:hypothetical protein